jgi:hypothetical protein
MAPAQLYSTESGRLFHSGRIVIATVGLPARGKTHISVALARYLRWLGVKTHIFHLGDYRRDIVGAHGEVPDDYFHVNARYGDIKDDVPVFDNLSLTFITAHHQFFFETRSSRSAEKTFYIS